MKKYATFLFLILFLVNSNDYAKAVSPRFMATIIPVSHLYVIDFAFRSSP